MACRRSCSWRWGPRVLVFSPGFGGGFQLAGLPKERALDGLDSDAAALYCRGGAHSYPGQGLPLLQLALSEQSRGGMGRSPSQHFSPVLLRGGTAMCSLSVHLRSRGLLKRLPPIAARTVHLAVWCSSRSMADASRHSARELGPFRSEASAVDHQTSDLPPGPASRLST